MKKSKFAIASLGLFLMFSLTAYATERAQPEFDHRHWKLGWSRNNGEAIFEEYVLEGETVENWSELITSQFYPGLQKVTNPDLFEGGKRAYLSLVCPEIVWKSLYQTPGERMWEWSIQGCQGQQDQSEIARLVRTQQGFHILHYAIKKVPLYDNIRQLWINKLKAFKITES